MLSRRSLLTAFAMCGLASSCREPPQEKPEVTLIVTVPPETIDHFSLELERFAKARRIRFEKAPPERMGFTAIRLGAPGVEVIAANPFTPEEFQISFYKLRGSQGASDQEVARLVEDFEGLLDTISGVRSSRAPAGE
jgi:hypothetical protein